VHQSGAIRAYPQAALAIADNRGDVLQSRWLALGCKNAAGIMSQTAVTSNPQAAGGVFMKGQDHQISETLADPVSAAGRKRCKQASTDPSVVRQ
jgi:hypothetical protein